MSKKRELKQRADSIDDMRSIITAMKSLALMESKKLSHYIADQGKAANSARAATCDFLSFFPLLGTSTDKTDRSGSIIIAIGADRGFCGDFNQLVVDAVEREIKLMGSAATATIAIGDRLSAKLSKRVELMDSVNGATFAEEVPEVLAKVLQLVRHKMETDKEALVKLRIIGHQHGTEAVCIVEPLSELQQLPHTYTNAPQLNLSPEKFFGKLLFHYFQFVLYQFFYSSLMSENVKRLMHLETAIQRLERNSIELNFHYNQARQEEITEEIEILLMNDRSIESRQSTKNHS